MSTGKFGTAAVAIAGLAFTIFFTGCGGDGGGPAQAAPSTLQAQSYNFSPNTGGQTAVSFTSAEAYTFQHETGAVEQGTYQATRNGNLWTVTLQSTSSGQQIYEMTFTSNSGGSFVLKRSAEADRFGPFAARSSTVPSGDVTTGAGSTTTASSGGTSAGATTTASTTGSTTTATTSGSTTTATTTGSTTTSSSTGTTTSGTTTSGTSTTGTSTTGSSTTGSTTTGTVTPSSAYTGNAPVSIAGRVMSGTRTFTSTGTSGQTHTYTFGNGTFHDEDAPEQADGAFVYSANNSSASLTLNYTSPQTFVGDKHQLAMTFSVKDQGDFQSTYTRGDGTVITINGTFKFDPIP